MLRMQARLRKTDQQRVTTAPCGLCATARLQNTLRIAIRWCGVPRVTRAHGLAFHLAHTLVAPPASGLASSHARSRTALAGRPGGRGEARLRHVLPGRAS